MKRLQLVCCLITITLVNADLMSQENDREMNPHPKMQQGERAGNTRRFRQREDGEDDQQMRRRFAQNRGGMMNRGPQRYFANYLKMIDPEKYKELEKLQKENPEEYRKQVEQISNDFRRKMMEEQQQLKTLADKYRENKDEKTLNELKALLKTQFERKLKMEKVQLDDMKKRYDEMAERYQTRQEKMDQIIQSKIKELTRDPVMNW